MVRSRAKVTNKRRTFDIIFLIRIQDTGAGLVAAALISIVPGYISRSVAGSYDNEGTKIFHNRSQRTVNSNHVHPFSAIAIFCMLLTYYGWIKAVKSGSIYWGMFTALAYFYMVSVRDRIVAHCRRNIKTLGSYAGFVVGRLRVPDKSDSAARAGVDGDRTFLEPHLRRVQRRILSRNRAIDADTVRRLPTGV